MAFICVNKCNKKPKLIR